MNLKSTVNPLLDFSGLPRYGSVRPEHVASAIDQLLAENRTLIARLTAEGAAASWNGFAEPLEDANERLWRAWGVVAHLHAVDDSAAIRDAYNTNLPKITRYRTELAQNLDLYEKFKALRASPGFEELSQAQRKIVENDLRDYRLGGAELEPRNKRRFGEIQEELAALETKFSENLLDATNAFSALITDRGELLGVPDDVLEAAKQAARRGGQEGWKFTLQAPSYGPLMQYAENRGLRENLYRAHVTRASELGDAELDNTSIIVRELRLRQEKARLLGYESFAEFSLVPKMAESPEAALDFLNDLASRALPQARRDYAELEEFARTELGIQELQAWDIAFASEKLRAKRYAFSDQEVKRYFPEPQVLEGMFRLVETLYGIRIFPDVAETWHPDVRFFRIADSDESLIDGWEGLVEDITDQRALSQNLRKMTNMLQVLITNLPTVTTHVTDEWFIGAPDAELFGAKVRLVPPTQFIWSKIFVQDHHRYDMADVAHMILKCHQAVDWKQLLSHMELYWEVLLMALLNFRFVYPSERRLIPQWLMDELIERLRDQADVKGPGKKVCRGRIFSPRDYAIDVEQWGFSEAVGNLEEQYGE